jgi:hypothetical protein
MKLLYRTSEWHALAKLRMQTDRTLDYMSTITLEFGKLMRQFCDLSNESFAVYETDREMVAHNRRQAEKCSSAPGASNKTPKGRRRKFLNLLTYKFHAIGDYVPTICLFGPTDVYSTQLVRTYI